MKLQTESKGQKSLSLRIKLNSRAYTQLEIHHDGKAIKLPQLVMKVWK